MLDIVSHIEAKLRGKKTDTRFLFVRQHGRVLNIAVVGNAGSDTGPDLLDARELEKSEIYIGIMAPLPGFISAVLLQ